MVVINDVFKGKAVIKDSIWKKLNKKEYEELVKEKEKLENAPVIKQLKNIISEMESVFPSWMAIEGYEPTPEEERILSKLESKLKQLESHPLVRRYEDISSKIMRHETATLIENVKKTINECARKHKYDPESFGSCVMKMTKKER